MISSLLTNIYINSSVYWIFHKYHKNGFNFPCCGKTLLVDVGLVSTWLSGDRLYCPSCKKTINPRLGTPLYGTHWSPDDFVKFLIMKELGRSTEEISAILGKTPRAVRDMAERTALIDAKIEAETIPISEQQRTASG